MLSKNRIRKKAEKVGEIVMSMSVGFAAAYLSLTIRYPLADTVPVTDITVTRRPDATMSVEPPLETSTILRQRVITLSTAATTEATTEPPTIATTSCPVDHVGQAISALSTGNVSAAAQHLEHYSTQQATLGNAPVELVAEDLLLLAKIIYTEAGSDWLSDEHQYAVASVLLNRVASPEFPNTLKECVYQPGQYSGVNTAYFKNLVPNERAFKNALYMLENGSQLPATVVFQAGFKQGSGVYKSIADKYLGTTYFCYSSYPGLYN